MEQKFKINPHGTVWRMEITCLLEIKTCKTMLSQKIPLFNKCISLIHMLFHFQIKHNGLVFVPSPRNNELGNSISEIEILSLMSITYYVVLPILGAKKKT